MFSVGLIMSKCNFNFLVSFTYFYFPPFLWFHICQYGHAKSQLVIPSLFLPFKREGNFIDLGLKPTHVKENWVTRFKEPQRKLDGNFIDPRQTNPCKVTMPSLLCWYNKLPRGRGVGISIRQTYITHDICLYGYVSPGRQFWLFCVTLKKTLPDCCGPT